MANWSFRRAEKILELLLEDFPASHRIDDTGGMQIWLVVAANPSEKWWSEFVSWDDDIPNIWEKMFQTTN